MYAGYMSEEQAEALAEERHLERTGRGFISDRDNDEMSAQATARYERALGRVWGDDE